MLTILRSNECVLEIEWGIKIENKGLIKRVFLFIQLLDTKFLYENMWNLLPTINSKDNWLSDSDLSDLVFDKSRTEEMVVLNGKKCIVYNTTIGRYKLFTIWEVDSDEVDFVVNYINEMGINSYMTSEGIIRKYGIADIIKE